MNALDWIMLSIVTVNLIYSTWKGFIRDVFSLAGLIGGFVIASRFYPLVANLLRPWIDSELAASVIGWGGVFLIIYIATKIVGRLIRGSLRLLRMGWLDRVAGFLFGLVKGTLLCAALLVVIVTFLPPGDPFLKESLFVPYVMELTSELGRLVPGNLGERFRVSPDRKGKGPGQTARQTKIRLLKGSGVRRFKGSRLENNNTPHSVNSYRLPTKVWFWNLEPFNPKSAIQNPKSEEFSSGTSPGPAATGLDVTLTEVAGP